MKYIDKLNTTNARQGVKKTQKFIDDCWQDGSYKDLTYEQYKNDSGFTDILVKDQVDNRSEKAFCCYCMRTLIVNNSSVDHPENVTLEHIIPHHISQSDWNKDCHKYQAYGNLDANRVNVCIGGVLSNIATQIKSLPHPHFISYHNLVVSCDGKILEGNEIVSSHCCNNMRGNRYVEPLYLKSDVGSLIKYDSKGCLDFDDDIINLEWFDNSHLNLSAPGLNKIRRLWYLISRTQYTPADVCSAETDEELKRKILDDAIKGKTSLWSSFYDIKNVWNLFSEYSWFYGYYRAHYPLTNTSA